MVTSDTGDAPPRIMDLATAFVRVYTRAFLAQGVGIIGLVWCLSQNLPWVALGLAALVLIDQAIFLRGRPILTGSAKLQAALDIWCLLVSCIDLLLLFAALFRAAGLREAAGGPVSDPLSCFAFALATLARLDLGLVPIGAAGRLAAAFEALLGDLALLAAFAVVVRSAARRFVDVRRP